VFQRFVQNISSILDVCCKHSDLDIAHISDICCNSMFQMFQLFQFYVAVSVFMLQVAVFYLVVAYVSHICCNCMFHIFLYVSYLCCIHVFHVIRRVRGVGSDGVTARALGMGHSKLGAGEQGMLRAGG
jgi:hypothetical protein